MTREELDALWFQAMRQSIEAGENFTRYHFAALVAAAEREACAKLCFDMAQRHNDIRSAALEMASEYIRARGEA